MSWRRFQFRFRRHRTAVTTASGQPFGRSSSVTSRFRRHRTASTEQPGITYRSQFCGTEQPRSSRLQQSPRSRRQPRFRQVSVSTAPTSRYLDVPLRRRVQGSLVSVSTAPNSRHDATSPALSTPRTPTRSRFRRHRTAIATLDAGSPAVSVLDGTEVALVAESSRFQRHRTAVTTRSWCCRRMQPLHGPHTEARRGTNSAVASWTAPRSRYDRDREACAAGPPAPVSVSMAPNSRCDSPSSGSRRSVQALRLGFNGTEQPRRTVSITVPALRRRTAAATRLLPRARVSVFHGTGQPLSLLFSCQMNARWQSRVRRSRSAATRSLRSPAASRRPRASSCSTSTRARRPAPWSETSSVQAD